MSALLNVAPLQTLKIANRTKLDDLDDEDDDGSAHAMVESPSTHTKNEQPGGVS